MPITDRTKELADDAGQGKVLIKQTALVRAERLLQQVGAGQDVVPIGVHHFLVGGVAYLMSKQGPMPPAAVSAFVRDNRELFKRLVSAALVDDEPVEDD